MATKSIEATLRLASDFAKAIADLKALRQEAATTKRELGQASAAKPAAEAPAASRRKAEAAAAAAGEEEVTRQRQEGHKRRSAADRAAEAEALAAKRAAMRAQAEVERAERKRQRDEAEADRKRQRAAEVAADRERQRAAGASNAAQREGTRRAAQVAPQVTDIVTSLAGGQNPALVALQQGGQLRDIFGSFSAAGRALLGTLTATRVVVGGIGAGLAVVVGQIISGHRESEQLRRTLALTGNAGGASLGQISAQAKAIAAEMGVGIGSARAAVAGLLTISGQTANTMGPTGRAIAATMKLTGESAEEATKRFADQASGVTDWATKANRAFNFLTPEQVAYIRRLEQQGRIQEAIRFTNDQLADSLKQRTAPAIGTLEKAWNSVTTALGNFLDKMKELGRDTTPEERLAKLQQRVTEIQARLERKGPFAGRRSSTDRTDLEAAQQEIQGILRDQQRKQDAALAAQEAQAKIDATSLAATQAASATRLAQIQADAAKEVAAIDRKQEEIESAYARGLVSEVARNTRLNELDQQRLAQQIKIAEAQIAQAERVAKATSEKNAHQQAQAQVTEAGAQLTALQSRLLTAEAEGRRIVDADTLAQSRESAQAWADTWLRASQRVRELSQSNAVTAAGRIADPAQRAQADADARTSEMRRTLKEQVGEIELRIKLSPSPESRAELKRQLDQLQTEGAQAIDEASRVAMQQSVGAQIGDQLEALRIAEERLSFEVERGAITSEEAERRKFAAREAALPQLKLMLEIMRTLARTDAERNAIDALLLKINQLGVKTTELQATFKSSATSGLATLFTDLVTGAEKADVALGKFVSNFARSMLEVINKKLAEQLVNDAIAAMQSFASQSGGGGGNWLGSIVSMFVGSAHTGGVIDGVARAGRTVSPWVFAGAQVLHGGGIAGLMSDEVPTILRKGEEVLTEDDPRHVRNLRTGGGPLIGNFNVSISFEGGSSETSAADAAMARKLGDLVRVAVEQKLAEEMRPGGALQNVRNG